MQKVINVLAIASTAVSVAVVGSGLYVYVNRDSIIDGVKSQVMEAVLGGVGKCCCWRNINLLNNV